MEESVAETVGDTKTTEADQIVVSEKTYGGRPSEQRKSLKESSENEEGEGKDEDRSGSGDEDIGEKVEVEGEEVDESNLTPEALEALQRQKKKKRREEKRLARERLDKHYKSPEPETAPPSRRQSKLEKEGDDDEEADDKESEKTELTEAAEYQPQVENLERLQSSLAVSETEDLRTAISSSEDESDYARGPLGVSFKTDFLELFYLPSMSDITSESSEEPLSFIRATTEVVAPLEELDEGHFVNPLTGETESSSTKEEEPEPVKEEVEEEEESSSSEFIWPFDDDDDIPIVTMKADAAQMAMEMFLDIQQSHIQVREESTTANELERAMRETRQIAFDFLKKMIDDAVEIAEYVDPIKELRGKLDKPKLMAQLQKLYGQYLAAKFFNTDVNNKMYEYYRRVGQLRCFDHLAPKVELVEYYRYMEAIHLLDHLKSKAEETKKTNSAVLSSVKLDLDYAHNIAIKSVDSLEACFREILLRKDVEYLPRVVENELRRMQLVRNEVSDSRLWLITRQHTLGSLVERKRNFDQITEELTMDQFLLAQREVVALGTKVEERNHDLNRMRDRCTKHMHQLAFIREKISMNSATLVSKRIKLDEQIKKQGLLRDKLLKLKLQHASLNAQKNELYDKCGLLFKTALLHDYDATEDYITLKRTTVKDLRTTVMELESRIAVYERQARDSDAAFFMQLKLQQKRKGKH